MVPATVTKFPTANAAETGAGLTNPNSAHADDGVYATAAPGGKNITLATKYQNFGFDTALPTAATISKVQLIYKFKVDTQASVATGRIYYKINGVAGVNNDDTTEPLTDKVNTYDVTLLRTWTYEDLKNGTFEVALAAVQGNSATAVTFSFDYVKVSIDYSISYPNNYMFPSASDSNPGIVSVTEKIR